MKRSLFFSLLLLLPTILSAQLIRTGGGKGAIYGVVTLLESYFGVHYYTYETYDLITSADLMLPAFNRYETPAFRYRQTQSYGNEDPIYKQWFRLEEPKEIFAGNLWVHVETLGNCPSWHYGVGYAAWFFLDEVIVR